MAYLFDPEQLHEITKRVIGQPREQMFTQLINELAEAYPGHIETKRDWIFNLSGGAIGIMTVLHGSLSEYLLLFGTPNGAEGCSGTFRINIWDYVMDGEMWTYTDADPLTKVVTKPGEYAFLKPGQCKGWRAPDTVWMLEYGRGFIPSCLPLGLADAAFSVLDATIIAKTIYTYGRLTVRELLKGKI
jgi:hypothetical protein